MPTPPRLPASLLADMGDKELPPARRREAAQRVFEHVYRVIAVVLRRSAADVEDASQDALMSILKAGGDLAATAGRTADATAWVNAVAARRAIDYRRRCQVRAGRSLDEDILVEIADSRWPDEAIARAHLVNRLLADLDETHRALVVLRYWGDLTDEDIAASLEMPLGTVKTRLRRAHTMLARTLDGFDAGRSYDIAISPGRAR